MMAIENLQRIVPPLTEWFRAFARDLPWRSDPLPYYVWISEIMLQQTRVEAVKPYFRRFTEALPDVKALADCPEEELFKLWEGLGYYSRARNQPCCLCRGSAPIRPAPLRPSLSEFP